MPSGGRYGRRLAGALVGAAVLAVVWTALGAWADGPGALVLLTLAYHHLTLTGWLVVGALSGAVFAGRRRGERAAAAFVVIPLAAGWLMVGGLAGALTGDGAEVASSTAPGRPDRRLVVHSDFGLLDPHWTVYVEQGTWPAVRRWPVASFNGDAADNGFAGASWEGPSRIRLDPAEGPPAHVTVAPSGRPASYATFG
ncbi:hypothetical protein [Streptomyces sp. NPDC101132]|uniref:hypothetical protein n=1 Tax=Streptomyces sp. NPDC101132 TaxID=3366110 RepID=UPI003813CC7A